MKKAIGFGLVELMVVVCVLAVLAVGAYAGWNYNPSDLSGSGCLQAHVDNLNAGVCSGLVRKVTIGPSASTVYAVDTGTATNGQVVSFSYTFSAAPAVFIVQAATNTTYIPTSITVSNFTADLVGATTTQRWFAIGAK